MNPNYDNDAWLAELAIQEEQERQAYAQMQQATTEWKTKYPNYCTNCGGWGGFVTRNYPHAPDDFDPCEALPGNACHRCGELGLHPEDPEFSNPHEDCFIGPCSNCGWTGTNLGDGCPEW